MIPVPYDMHPTLFCGLQVSYLVIFTLLSLQGTSRRILGGIVKGFKGGKVGDRNDATFPSKSYYRDLDGVFWRNPFPDPSSAVTQNQEVVEVSIGLVVISMFTNLSLSFLLQLSSCFFFLVLLQMISKLTNLYQWHLLQQINQRKIRKVK